MTTKNSLYEPSASLPRSLALVAIIGFPLSIWFILAFKTDPIVTWYKLSCQAIGALWVLGPPLWFFFEHFYYFPQHKSPQSDSAQLKTAQDLAAKVWASFVVVLAALFTGAYPK